MNFFDLQTKKTLSAEALSHSKTLLDNLKEKDAIPLRKDVLNAIVCAYARYLSEEQAKTPLEIDESVSAVVEGVVNDNTITKEEGDHIKVTAMSIYRKKVDVKQLALNYLTKSLVASYENRVFGNEVYLAAHDILKHTKIIDESADVIVEKVSLAAIAEMLPKIEHHLDPLFVSRL